MILENPFYRLKDIIIEKSILYKLLNFLITEKWKNYNYITKKYYEILFIISENDTLVRKHHFEKLYNISKKAKYVNILKATHFNAYKQEGYYEIIGDYINTE
jgi:alpha/beta superfamily hydrolase